jgi:hypothetical protein
MPVETQSPTRYWLRSSDFYYNNHAMHVDPSSGHWAGSGVVDYSTDGFRPAGVFLENVTICEELCFLDKLFLFQREQVALQNLDQQYLNSLKELVAFKIGIVDAPFSISTPIQYVPFHNHYIGVTRTLNCYNSIQKI